MLQHFVQYCFKFLAALNFYRGPRPFALSLGFGCFLGIMYGENALLVLLCFILACLLPLNHILMLITSLFFSAVGILFFAWQLRIGAFLLGSDLLFYLFQFLDNIPLLPWFGLNWASNLGALILGPLTGALVFALSYRILLHNTWLTRLLHGPKLHSHRFQKWEEEYKTAFKALELAHRVQKEIKQRELDRPDSY